MVSTHATFVSTLASADCTMLPSVSKMSFHMPMGISISAMAEMEEAAALRTAIERSSRH